MKFGSPFGSGFGSPSKHLSASTWVSPNRSGAIRLKPVPTTGIGNAYYGIYVNAQLVISRYYEEGDEGVILTVPTNGEVYSIAIMRHGHASTYNMSRVVRLGYSYVYSKKVSVFWDWESSILGIPGNDDFSSWTLSGITKDNLESHDLNTRRKLTVTLTDLSGIASIVINRYNLEVASGSGAYPGTITLTESNDSGISGSVVVADAPTEITDENLVIRFPNAINIYRDDVEVGTAYFPAVSWVEPNDLDPGAYNYSYAFVSDTGEEGTVSDPVEMTINGPPYRPTNIAYDSGNAAATIMSFTASTTDGASYVAYLQQPDEDFINFNLPAATASPVVGSPDTGYITLPAINYPGTAYVVVRATYGGIEESNVMRVALEYDSSGVYLEQRPNNSSIGTWSLSSGTELAVTAEYNSRDELATPTIINLYARETGGNYSLIDSATISQGSASLTATLTNGWWYISTKAETATGVVSEDYSDPILIYVSDTVLSEPTVETYVSRG